MSGYCSRSILDMTGVEVFEVFKHKELEWTSREKVWEALTIERQMSPELSTAKYYLYKNVMWLTFQQL